MARGARGVGVVVDSGGTAFPVVAPFFLLVGRAFLTFFRVAFRFDLATVVRDEEALVVAGCGGDGEPGEVTAALLEEDAVKMTAALAVVMESVQGTGALEEDGLVKVTAALDVVIARCVNSLAQVTVKGGGGGVEGGDAESVSAS
jgi:hypothetical protein